ncbi:hypothetical protein CTI12_AA346040 [Artemisia annua]|uniref:Uncharacterized protein n=1 Tax=Artemisia annua TaxID=35608 RepID=A0A2U1MSK9_ARTAN|nr:hypothetical protein CTI12_AA346040 [Artemisia annua]
MASRQALLSYDDDDQSQGQLRREDFAEQTENSSLINQKNGSVNTTAYGATNMAAGAMGLAQGAAMGAANLAQGAATAVRNSLGNNQQSHNLHTPLSTGLPQNTRY